MINTPPSTCNKKNFIISVVLLVFNVILILYYFKLVTWLESEIFSTRNPLPNTPIDVQPCHWMSLPLKIRYPRYRTNVTFPRMFQCIKELNAKQDNKTILWLPAADTGSLLQPVALGGSHGFRTDSDLDIWLLTTLDLGIYEHCSTDVIGKHFFQRVQEINETTLPKRFQNRCECEFNGIKMYCQTNAYELLEKEFGKSWWFPISKGGKSMADYYKPHWGDPSTWERKHRWFMEIGKENFEGLKMYDKNNDFQIDWDDMIWWLKSHTDQFNMDWFFYQMEENPCRLENGRIDLNHSMWWWHLLDDAFGHRWDMNMTFDLSHKYIAASYETNKIKCKSKLIEIAQLRTELI